NVTGVQTCALPISPKILTMQIKPEKIRDVIGPSGKQINQIIEDTGVKIDIEQDGGVFISSTDAKMNEKAKKIIEDLVREVEVGQMYLGKVKRIRSEERRVGKECRYRR